MNKKSKPVPQPKPQKSGLFGKKPQQPKKDDRKKPMSFEELLWLDEILDDDDD